jgi:hypothetical protein
MALIVGFALARDNRATQSGLCGNVRTACRSREALQPAPHTRAVVAIDVAELALEIGFLAGHHTPSRMTRAKGMSVASSQRLSKAMARPASPRDMFTEVENRMTMGSDLAVRQTRE